MSGSRFRPATRRAAWLRVLLLGMSKAGKTYTALSVAHHLAKALGIGPEKVGVIDAEEVGEGANAVARSEMLVGEPCACARCNGRGLVLEGHQVLALPAHRRGPDDYVDAIREAATAGFQVLVIDGITPEWESCLKEVDAAGGNKTAAWGPVTKKHDAFLRAMQSFPGHLLATCRVKDKVEIGEDRKTRDLGAQPIQRDQIVYEFDVGLWLHRAHARAESRHPPLNERTWDRPGAELADVMLAWARRGESAQAEHADLIARCLKAIEEAPEAMRDAARSWLAQHGNEPRAHQRMLERLDGAKKSQADPAKEPAKQEQKQVAGAPSPEDQVKQWPGVGMIDGPPVKKAGPSRPAKKEGA